MKHFAPPSVFLILVAPHTGAWIETSMKIASEHSKLVAPHTGAWIETQLTGIALSAVESHPTRVRGLKPDFSNVFWLEVLVAPHTGAWIETVHTTQL